MRIKTSQYGDHQVIHLQNDFDAEFVNKTRDQLETIVAHPSQTLVFDLEHVHFIDSSGIGALVFIFKRLRSENRQMALIGLTGQPANMVKLLRIDQAIRPYKDYDSYLTAMKTLH